MKPTFSEKFKYWFDTQMSRGTRALIKILVIFTILAIAVIALVAFFTGNSAEETGADVAWDSFATIINAWMPYYSDGEGSISYLIIMGIAAIIGLLITSVLIGIISTAIEERISSLKEGKSKVIEKDHIIVLGFTPGEYTLINQLIMAADGEKRKIVIGCDMSCEEVKDLVYDNLDVPRNVKLIFRTVDIFDPVSISKCSPESCSRILISPMDDKLTTKALLAVSLLINNTDNKDVRVSALVSSHEYDFPATVAAKHNVTTIQMHHIIARIISHSCTQTGLSDTFREIFAFYGNELYVIERPEAAGLTFRELMYRMDKAVPMGIIRDGQSYLNPAPDFMIESGDRLIVFEENRDAASIGVSDYQNLPMAGCQGEAESHRVAVIGHNDSYDLIVRELPSNATVAAYDNDILNDNALLKLAQSADHVVLLSDYELEDDDADLKIMFLIMKLRDLRTRYGLSFNITAEMCKKSNQDLIMDDEDHIDYVVASNMSSLFLAQISENFELVDVFKEILASRGNEFYLKRAGDFGCDGDYTTLQLRNIALSSHFVMVGYLKVPEYTSFFNPGLEETIHLDADDCLIVLGEE